MIRVIKLGGSLLDHADLVAQFRNWQQSLPPAIDVVVVGGGRMADAVRAYDAQHSIDEAVAHRLCIQAMSINAELVAHWMPEWSKIDSLPAVARLGQPAHVVFDVQSFLLNDEPNWDAHPLPRGWHVTSDSIAARVAQVLSAHELILLKRVQAASTSPAAWRRNGIVDDYFPVACAPLSQVSIHQLVASDTPCD